MVKLYDYIKSKEDELGEGFFCKIEIEKTNNEDKVLIHYRSIFSKETNKKEGLSYLIFKNNRSIDIFMTVGNIYADIKQIDGYVKEGKRLKKLFNIKEFKKADAGNIDHI